MANHLKFINYLRGEKDIVRSLTDQLPIGIYRTSFDGKILYANPTLARILEYDLAELYKLNSNDLFIRKEQRNQEIESLLKTPNEKVTQELHLRTKSGKTIIAKDIVNVIRNRRGNIKYFDGVLEDITSTRNAEKEILKLSTAITQSPASVIITDLKGNIEYVNPKFSEVTGYSASEVLGKNPKILKTEHTTSDSYQEMWETISSGGTWRGEFLNKRKDGTNYWELASISPIIDNQGNTIQYLAIKEDITKRKAIQDALIKSELELKQANATKNMFFSIMAHDLKGPIGSFYQLLSLYKDNFDELSNNEKLDYVNILLGLSGKTNNLLEDILLWARIQMNTLEFETGNYNLNNIITETIYLLKERTSEKDITIISDVNNEIDVNVNRDSVKTILRNLLSNAIKFSPRKSKIKISAKLANNKEFIQISIQDKGVGIPKENLDKLFKIESTFTTYGTEKEKGTGLGLILCKELVNKNGGKILVESKEGVGSTFIFTILEKK
jgi:hypothetical protein